MSCLASSCRVSSGGHQDLVWNSSIPPEDTLINYPIKGTVHVISNDPSFDEFTKVPL